MFLLRYSVCDNIFFVNFCLRWQFLSRFQIILLRKFISKFSYSDSQIVAKQNKYDLRAKNHICLLLLIAITKLFFKYSLLNYIEKKKFLQTKKQKKLKIAIAKFVYLYILYITRYKYCIIKKLHLKKY